MLPLIYFKLTYFDGTVNYSKSDIFLFPRIVEQRRREIAQGMKLQTITKETYDKFSSEVKK